MICFPIHSYSSHAGTTLKIFPVSTGALQPVLEDGVAPAFPAGPTLAWLPPAAQAGHSCHPLPSHVTGKESPCNKCPSITCPTAEFSPLAQCHTCFSVCQLATSLLFPMSSEQNPHWQPEAGQPQLTASSLLLFLCQLSSWHQCGEQNCCLCVPAAQTNNRASSSLSPVWAVHLRLALSPTGYRHEAPWPPPVGQGQLCALRSAHSLGQCQFLAVSKPDCSHRYEQQLLYFTTHITADKVILGTPSPMPGSCAHGLTPWLSSFWYNLAFHSSTD